MRKWGGYSEEAAERVNGFMAKALAGRKGAYVLMILGVLVLLGGAFHKWG